MIKHGGQTDTPHCTGANFQVKLWAWALNMNKLINIEVNPTTVQCFANSLVIISRINNVFHWTIVKQCFLAVFMESNLILRE